MQALRHRSQGLFPGLIVGVSHVGNFEDHATRDVRQ